MSEQELLGLTISELAPKIKSREISPVEITQTALHQIERLNPLVNSFITLLPDAAMARARELEEALMQGQYLGPLHGIPIGIKDNLATKGIRTTIGSKIYADYVPEENAFVVDQCQAAGAVILGKENLHEFAMGTTCDNPHYGAIHNPWALDCIPGGSSGGSAANVATSMTCASLGTDAGGSVRIPAALCGVVGLKPTYGRVSQRGLLSSALVNDHVGPLTRSVKDNALLFQVIISYDPLDVTSVPVPVPDYAATLEKGLRGLKMGIPKNYYFDQMDSEVDAAVRQAIMALEKSGVALKEISLPSLEHAGALRVVGSVENLLLHEELIRKHRQDYGRDELYRMLAAQFIPAIDYARCLRVQRLIKDELNRVLQEVDFLVTATVPIPAFPIAAESVTVQGIRYPMKGPGRIATIVSRNTSLSNQTGLPSLSVPCGFTAKGLPIGLQLVGRPFEEELLLRVGYHYEAVSPARGKRPKIAG